MISIKITSAMGSTHGHLGLHRQPDLAIGKRRVGNLLWKLQPRQDRFTFVLALNRLVSSFGGITRLVIYR